MEWYKTDRYFDKLNLNGKVVFFPTRGGWVDSYKDSKVYKTFNQFLERNKNEKFPILFYEKMSDRRKGFNVGYLVIMFRKDLKEWYPIGEIVELKTLKEPENPELYSIWEKMKRK